MRDLEINHKALNKLLRELRPITPFFWLDTIDRGKFPTEVTMLCTIMAETHPVVEGELPLDGNRFEGLIPHIVPNNLFDICKKAPPRVYP